MQLRSSMICNVCNRQVKQTGSSQVNQRVFVSAKIEHNVVGFFWEHRVVQLEA